LKDEEKRDIKIIAKDNVYKFDLKGTLPKNFEIANEINRRINDFNQQNIKDFKFTLYFNIDDNINRDDAFKVYKSMIYSNEDISIKPTFDGYRLLKMTIARNVGE